MYYLQSRYYDPAVGRFINADSLAQTYDSSIGANMFAYCGNSPCSGIDEDGEAFETIWDVVTLAAGVADVATNPYDPMAWIALAGDVADVLLPFVGGIGETTRALRAVSQTSAAADAVSDVKKGWKVGEDITNLTRAGNAPSWSTLKSRYWKNKAHFFENDYSDSNLKRMRRGLAPQYDDGAGIYSMELHHMLGRNGDSYYIFFEVTPEEHAAIDSFRHLRLR